MVDVFLSHVEEDRELALEIARGLEAAGYTVWYYERDTRPGVSYLTQISRVIKDCRAVALVISSDTLSSLQVDKEVDCAHEYGKPLIPLLVDLKHDDFRSRQPKWAMAIGTIASLPLSRAEVAASIPHIVGGLRELVQNAASTAPSPGSGHVATPAAYTVADSSNKPAWQPKISSRWRLYGPWALATILGSALGALVGRGPDSGGLLGKLISPDVIQAASQSTLGVLALMIVVLGVLAGLFFGRASVRVRVMIFALIFGGAVAFGAAVVRTRPFPDDNGPTPSPTARRKPTLDPVQREPTLDFQQR